MFGLGKPDDPDNPSRPPSTSLHTPAMGRSTWTPSQMDRNVAIEYPKVPTSTAGTTADFQPFATHMPAAVVGPPTFALLPMSRSLSPTLSALPTCDAEEPQQAAPFQTAALRGGDAAAPDGQRSDATHPQKER